MSLCWACLGNLPFLIIWFWSNRNSDLLPKSCLQDLSRQDTYMLIIFEASVVYNWRGQWKRAKSWAVLGCAWYPHSCSSASDNISLLNCAVLFFPRLKKFFFNLFSIEGWLLYNVLLFSAIRQCKSGRGIHVAPPSWTYPTYHPIPPLSAVLEHRCQFPESYKCHLPSGSHRVA